MIDHLPVSSLKKYLYSVMPSGWEHFETETILLDLNMKVTPLLMEKIGFIKALSVKPELFYKDALFFLHACEVFNNQVTDFERLPHVNSLEAAFAIVDMAKCQDLLPETTETYSIGVRLVIQDILTDDGYSSPVWPFDNVGVTGLVAGATEEDMNNKAKAIKEYVYGNYPKSTN